MKFVALLTIMDQDLNQKHRPDHLRYINELYGVGKVTQAGPFTDGSGGMVVYEADSWEEAERLAQADPVVVHKARSLILRPWSPLQFPLL